MFILDLEQDHDAPTLEQWLQNWWANLKARLRIQTGPETMAGEAKNDRDYPKSLIL
jgi:hypothetical protein